MKDVLSIWNRLLRRSYAAVNTNSNTFRRSSVETAASDGDLTFWGKYKSVLTAAALGVVAIGMGLLIFLTNPYEALFNWKCTFGPNGEIFELWRQPPVDLYLRVFLWNITNKDEFLSGQDDKLKLQEVGPYVYKELMSHENVKFNGNGTLTTEPKHPLVWVPELSEGRKEDDILILPNIALLSITHVVAEQSYFTRLGLNMLIRELDVQPLVQMTAREFMFGYESTLLSLGNNFMSNWIYFDKLGLIDRMYDFNGDFETVFTGETDITKAGLLDSYVGSSKIPQWDSPCGDIRFASDGTKFPGNIQPNDTLKFFRKSMCRAKTLSRTGEDVSNGLNVYTYTFSEDLDDNGWVHEKNKCFCKNPDKCLPSGLLDVHGCYYGFPIALSYPHFYAGDKVLSSKIIGTNPDPAVHKSFFKIQPATGLPTEIAVRYQINMALGDLSAMANVERFSDMYLPLLWTETRLYSLPDYLATRFRIYINVLPLATEAAMYLFPVLGVAGLLFSVYKYKETRSTKNMFSSPWIEDELVLNIDRKISSYMPERRTTMSDKELEVYYNSLVTPLNQELNECTSDQEQELKEIIA